MTFDMRLGCAIGIGLAMAVPAAAAPPASPQQQIAMIAKPSVMRVWGAYTGTLELGRDRYQEAIGGSGTVSSTV